MTVAITKFADIAFSTSNLAGDIPWDAARGQWSPRPTMQPRQGATTAITGAEISERIVPVVFSYTGSSDTLEVAFDNLMSLLDPLNRNPRTLTGTRQDGTEVSLLALPTFPYGLELDGALNGLRVNFVAADPTWRHTTTTFMPGPASNNVFTIDASPETLAITNAGKARVAPLIALCLTTQRASQTSTVGWKKRKIQQITNNTIRNWRNEWVAFDLGDTAALVTAGNALASGADLRVRVEGRELPRTLQGWNTTRTFCHVPLSLPANESVDLEIVYGNSAALAADAKTMSRFTVFDGTYCAADLSSDSGTSTGGNTSSTFNDTGKAWPVNFWTGGYIQVLSGTGSPQRRRIASNTATQIVPDRNWSTTPTGVPYLLWKSGYMANGGIATSAGSTTVLNDTGQAFATDELVGATITNVTQGQSATVTANTATAVTTTTLAAGWGLNDVYYLERWGVLNYYVRQTDQSAYSHRGLWQINRRYSKPSKNGVNLRHPASWRRTTYLPNGDDFTQYSVVDYGPIGGHDHWYLGTLYAARRRSSDRTYSEEGQGDGVTTSDPRLFVGARFDYSLLNENSASGATTGIGKFAFAVRESGAGEWENIDEDDTRRTSPTVSSVAHYNLRDSEGNPQHVYLGALPQDEVAVAKDASINDDIRVELGTRMELFLDAANVTIGALGAEETIYHLTGTIGTSTSAATIRDTIEFGGPGHHFHLKSDEVLWIDCASGIFYTTGGAPISLSGGFLFRRYVPWAGVAKRYEDDTDNDGVLDEKVSAAWLPIPPGASSLFWTEVAVGELECLVSFSAGWLG